jgi:signal transduction histidine kinase
MRQKISMDLHDDIGASLSSLQIYGTIAEQTIETAPVKAMEMVKKMSTQSKEIMENMNDIVWSMKSGSVSNTSLEVKIKNFAASLLHDSNINFTFSIMPNVDDFITSITARKNILLIVKEAMNNMAKYSKAKNATLNLYTMGNQLYLQVKDDGVGFNKIDKLSGNGLENMQQRTNELKGNLEIISTPNEGTEIKIVFPSTHIH